MIDVTTRHSEPMADGAASGESYGLYLHIPFCHTRCVYCDFNTYIDLDHLQARYVAALTQEIRSAAAALSPGARPLARTIFFGGGTPTALSPAQLGALVATCRDAFVLADDAEVTVEANPGTVTEATLREMRAGGINRLSFGVQSFHDDELRFMGRLHDAETAQAAVGMARRAGFDNLSLDLIFGLPRQTMDRWQRTLDTALALAPEHFSLYSLIVEPGTPLHQWVRRGEVPTPDDDVAGEMYEYAIERLGAAGYTHYEVSNWARGTSEPLVPRYASQHNLIYWRNQPYLGLGAGAHSAVRGQRYGNVRRPERYISMVEAAQAGPPQVAPAQDPATVETIDSATAMGEQMMLGLRLVREGVGLAEFETRFGQPLQQVYSDVLAKLGPRGLLEWDEARLRLTPRGLMLANQVVCEFLPDPESV